MVSARLSFFLQLCSLRRSLNCRIFFLKDVIKHLFEGTLRSVLVCEECGTKRTLSEPFLNISLHISKEANMPGSGVSDKLTVDSCLEHFTSPEKLADPVDCPTCGKKTPTKKQHTFSKLPRVLCVHLKRFHAALNKKIDDFVAFPAYGLNMGPHLPHWYVLLTQAFFLPSKCTSCFFSLWQLLVAQA